MSVWYFSEAQSSWMLREKTIIPYTETGGSNLKSFHWPDWAIKRVNDLVTSGISIGESYKSVSEFINCLRSFEN